MQIIDFTHIGNEQTKELEKHNKYAKNKAEEHFDEIALNYEAAYLRAGYLDPKMCQKYVTDIAMENIIPKHRAQILDFGCGTGLVGEYLKGSGFENVTGIDISSKMLEQAE